MTINKQVLQYLCTEYTEEELDPILKKKWKLWKEVINTLYVFFRDNGDKKVDDFLNSMNDDFRTQFNNLREYYKDTQSLSLLNQDIEKQEVLGILDSKVSVSKLSLTYFLAREVGFLGNNVTAYAFGYKRVNPEISEKSDYIYQKINNETSQVLYSVEQNSNKKYCENLEETKLYVKNDTSDKVYIKEKEAEEIFIEEIKKVYKLINYKFDELKFDNELNLIQMRVLLLRSELGELLDGNGKNVNLVHIKTLDDFKNLYEGIEDSAKWHIKSSAVANKLINIYGDESNDRLKRKLIYNVPWDYSAIYGGKKNVFTAIKNNKQVIFTGAPGTGKTYGISRYIDIACLEDPISKTVNALNLDGKDSEEKKKNLMDAYATYTLKSGRKAKQKEFVQFHSSYDYSNFVEGLRPYQEGTNKPTFIRMDGIFKEFCRNVVEYNLENPDNKNKFYFIIDEINRADLGKVFGELMYGLEESYRKKEHHFDTQYKNLPTYRINSDGKKVQLYTYEELVALLKNGAKIELISTDKENKATTEEVKIKNNEIKVGNETKIDVDDFVGNTLKIDDEEIEVDVFGKGFYIPENIHIIGSMNDIDRSVVTIDFAMRRRFKWVDVKANDVMENTLTSIFRRAKLKDASYVVDEDVEDSEGESETEETNKNAKYLTTQVRNMNAVIFDPKGKKDETSGIYYGLNEAYHIGPAYFKSYDGTPKSLQDIWKKKVHPILQEYVRGYGEEKTKKFIEECSKKLFSLEKLENGIVEQVEAIIDGSVDAYESIIKKSEAKQIVFTGAPGTGKTYGITEAVKNICKKDKNRYKFVQFHSSYDYSDFVEGLRPVQMGDDTTFVRMDGIFKEFCRKAEGNPNEDYYFIIDEINRADLGKVFGELMFGLEESYRGKNNTIVTQYHNLDSYRIVGNEPVKIENDCFKDGFYIPENVHVIGSMNDIDRSVETFDFALRRRFHWITVEANDVMEKVFDGMKIKEIPCPSDPEVVKRIKDMNEKISSDGSKYGLSKAYHIGPAYFKNYSEEKNLEKLFDENIAPIVREYLRGRAEAEFFIDDLKNALTNNSEG